MSGDLDPALDAAAGVGEADVAAAELPAFAAVLDRARGLAPGTFDANAARGIHVQLTAVDDAAQLQPFIDAARRAGEADVRVAEVPPFPGRGRRRLAAPLLAVVAAAAAVLFALAGLERWRAVRTENDALDAAAAVHADSQAPGAVVDREDSPTRAKRRNAGPSSASATPPGAVTAVPTSVPDDDLAAPVEPDAAPEDAASEQDAAPTIGRPRTREKTTPARSERDRVADELRALDARAQRQLAAGDLDGADATLASLIRRGGRHRLVQLAFGDRFTIAHRRSARSAQVKLWTTYLRRFPRGQFADDARAGLCRHAAERDRLGCWQRYLADFAHGAYRGRARRAVEEAPPR